VYNVENGFMADGELSELSLRIQTLGPRQLGLYICRAQNKLGRAEKEFLVTEAFESKCVVGQCDEFVSSSSSNFILKSHGTLLILLWALI